MVLFYVLTVCTVTLPPGVNPIAVDKYIYLSIYLSIIQYFGVRRVARLALRFRYSVEKRAWFVSIFRRKGSPVRFDIPAKREPGAFRYSSANRVRYVSIFQRKESPVRFDIPAQREPGTFRYSGEKRARFHLYRRLGGPKFSKGTRNVTPYTRDRYPVIQR